MATTTAPGTSPFRSLRSRAAHAPAAFALVFALGAGLACDENAPTETRAPSGSTLTGATGNETALASQDDVSTMAIPLPVDQDVTTTWPDPAFWIRQRGTGDNGVFSITNSASVAHVLHSVHSGRGRAGVFALSNRQNSRPALWAVTLGTGQAGLFQVDNKSSAQNTLQASNNGHGLASAVYGVHNGTFGWGGTFDITNPGNTGTALAGRTDGQGRAGFFSSSNTSSTEPAVFILNRGRGHALEARADGAIPALKVSSHHLGLRRAAEFNGNVDINGTLTKSSGSFKIDHPLDPDRKYLSHSFVESPDMMNVYNGNATLDASGRATVELPEYFEALNKDFRYQLTAVGAPGPNLYVAAGVQRNQFKIAGGRPYAHVSWMITGVRRDAYAEEHRIKVEEEKPRESEKPQNVATW